MKRLVLQNRQKSRPLDRRLFRQIALGLLKELPEVTCFELVGHFLGDEEMTRLNETFLGHEGPTDVITFDHLETPDSSRLTGEIFICVDEAIRNARSFRTTWQSEITRYFVHGCLHLLGYDDKQPVARRKMKRQENLLVRRLARAFPLSRLQKQPNVRA